MRHGANGGWPCPVVPPGERGVPLRRMSGPSGSGEDPPMTDLPPAVVTAMRLIRRLGVEFVRRYHRLEVLPQIEPFPDEPVVACLLYTSPSPRDRTRSRMPSSA